MSTHQPPLPAAKRSPEGPVGAKTKSDTQPSQNGSKHPHTSEHGDSANARQNTTNRNSAGRS